MTQATRKLDAVRQAREKLGEAPTEQIAAFVETNFGLKLQPTIVNVLLGSLRERELLEQSKRKSEEEFTRMRAERAAGEKKGRKRKVASQDGA